MRALSRLCDAIWYQHHPLRWLLLPLALAYGSAVRMRRWLYSHDICRRVRVAVPVVVVGNVTVGGTGKTPCVIWLAERLRERGYRPGIVCSGYRGRAAGWPVEVTIDSDPALVGDEAVLLARRGRCPVVAGRDRVAAAERLLERDRVDVVLADDGLQHYRLARDVEIAVVDGERGLGNGHCLPAGPLREPARRLHEVDAVVVNGGSWGPAGVLRARIVATVVRQTATGSTKDLAEFRGQRVHAVAGIGNPARFFALLEAQGLVVDAHPLPDHAAIGAADLRFTDARSVMITEKDEVKCRRIAHPDVWCVIAHLQLAAADAECLLGIVLARLGAQQ